VASSPAPAPLDKGKRVLEVISDDEDYSGGIVFKRRRAARAPTPQQHPSRVVGPSGTIPLVPPLHHLQQSKRKGAMGPSPHRRHC